MGRLLGPFGVEGWIKVHAFTEAPGALGAFDRWAVRTREGWRELTLEGFKVHSKGPVAKFAGYNGRPAAEALRGAEVAVSRAALGEAEAGTLYQVDLLGLDVVDGAGARLGEVERFFQAGDAAVMVVRDAGKGERMIPFVREYVKAVDREARRITVDWKGE
jgi:16S rRNA processing protein RimM